MTPPLFYQPSGRVDRNAWLGVTGWGLPLDGVSGVAYCFAAWPAVWPR